jgi:hypothetical protein
MSQSTPSAPRPVSPPRSGPAFCGLAPEARKIQITFAASSDIEEIADLPIPPPELLPANRRSVLLRPVGDL